MSNADGHQSASTSNHVTEDKFIANYGEWACVSNKKIGAVVGWVSPIAGFICSFLYHDPLYKIHTTPNNSGFQTRRSEGKLAGLNLISKIKSGTIPFDPTTDSVDIVSHSMGHAYACGIIDALKESSLKFKFGRFYSLAPENACSSNGAIDLNLFEEVWQYGCNEKNPSWDQDGVAPQCPIPGIISTASPKVKKGRIYFPVNFDPKDYLESHSIVSYFWLFVIKSGNDGYIKSR